MTRKVLRLPEVKAITGRSRSSIYLGVSEGNFPPPVPLGARAIGWLEEEVEEWLAKKIEQRKIPARMGEERVIPPLKAGRGPETPRMSGLEGQPSLVTSSSVAASLVMAPRPGASPIGKQNSVRKSLKAELVKQ